MGAVAPQVFDEDVGGVGLRAEAVVAYVDARVGYGEPVDVEGIKSVGVLGEGLLRFVSIIARGY